jgi:LuxR family maltose regulon positive regulatory protein
MIDGRPAESEATLLEVVDPSRPQGPDANARSIAYALLARGLLDAGDLGGARQHLEHAAELRARQGIGAQGIQALIDALLARLAITAEADLALARSYLAHAQTVRPLLTWAIPGPALIARLDLAQAHLALADATAARLLLREASAILRRRPGMGVLADETQRLKEQVSSHFEMASGPSALTNAELRLVPWLATHLSFREMGERLFLSPNTVKTEALSIYRKLGASSRSEAVIAAVRFGLLDPAAVPSVLEAASWVDHLDG